MPAAFDSSISVSTEVTPSTLPVVVPGISEANLAAIASWKFIRRCGSAINLGRSIACRFVMTLFGRYCAMRPKRRIFPDSRLVYGLTQRSPWVGSAQ